MSKNIAYGCNWYLFSVVLVAAFRDVLESDEPISQLLLTINAKPVTPCYATKGGITDWDFNLFAAEVSALLSVIFCATTLTTVCHRANWWRNPRKRKKLQNKSPIPEIEIEWGGHFCIIMLLQFFFSSCTTCMHPSCLYPLYWRRT